MHPACGEIPVTDMLTRLACGEILMMDLLTHLVCGEDPEKGLLIHQECGESKEMILEYKKIGSYAEYIPHSKSLNDKNLEYSWYQINGFKNINQDAIDYLNVNPNNHVGDTYVKDQKEATCYEEGYTGDTYCKDCGAKIAEGTVISAGHKLDKVEAKAATHEADGNIECYVCSVCGKLFKDVDATEEITIADTVIAKGEHDYGDSYKSDTENHWKECDCSSIIEKAAHDFGECTVTKEATATEQGVRERICTVCGYKATEEIPATGTVTEPTKTDDTSKPTTPNDKNQTTENNQSDTSTKPENPSSPQTGDTSNLALWIVLMFVSAVGFGTATVLNRKKRVK